MSFCATCGAKLEAGNLFCTHCGNEIEPRARVAAPAFSAVIPTTEFPGSSSPSMSPGRSHSATIAIVLALLIPGAGQAYNGQPVKGFFLLFLSVLILPWLYSIYDAYARANQIASTGGRLGRGGFVWVFLQAWLMLNVAIFTLIALTVTGVLV